MRRSFFRLTAALAALGVAGKASAQAAGQARGAAGGRYKVVYQISEGTEQAVRAIGNLRNHLNGAPGTRIVVVALGRGIDFLVEGAKDDKGRPFDAPVAALAGMAWNSACATTRWPPSRCPKTSCCWRPRWCRPVWWRSPACSRTKALPISSRRRHTEEGT